MTRISLAADGSGASVEKISWPRRILTKPREVSDQELIEVLLAPWTRSTSTPRDVAAVILANAVREAIDLLDGGIRDMAERRGVSEESIRSGFVDDGSRYEWPLRCFVFGREQIFAESGVDEIQLGRLRAAQKIYFRMICVAPFLLIDPTEW